VLYEATLFSGRRVKVREITTNDEDVALKALGSKVDLQAPSSQRLLVQEFLKMMIVEVDDKPVSYQELQVWDNYFSVKETRQVEALYNKLHVPSDTEDEDFFKTMKPNSGGK